MGIFSGSSVFVFFFYGLAFFVLGTTVGIKIRGIRAFRLARVSRFLPGYGIFQGAEGWMDMFFLTGEIGPSAFLFYSFVEVVSFLFLIQFGVRILTSHGKRGWVRIAPIVLFLSWALGVFFLKPLFAVSGDWFVAVEAWSRYTIGFFAGVIVFYALISERHSLAEGLRGVENNLLYAGSSFGLLSVFTVIGPESSLFSRMVGIPVQIFMVICVLSIAYFITESLGVLESSSNIRVHQRMRDYAEQLEHSNRAKDLFTDILRHDLLNPVNVIQNASELITPDDSADELQMKLGMIMRNADIIQEITETASDYAKIEVADEMDFEEMSLSEIIGRAVENAHFSAEEKGIGIVNNVSSDLMILANPFILHVFSNLLSNAIKYSPEDSEVVIDIEAVGDGCRVLVKDNGIGVPDEYKEGIFDRFERVNKGGVNGVGLGLAIAKRMVELHNGEIWVEDNPSGGSIFVVTLPA